MEVRFENQFVADEKMLREVYSHLSLVRRLVFIIIFTVLTSWYVWIILWSGTTLLTGCMLLVCIGYIVWLVAEPHMRARRAVKQTKEFNDGDNPAYLITCTDEKMECRRKDSYFSVPYQKIDKVHFWKHSIVIRAGKSSQVVLSPTGFTQGTFEEFKQFLRTKCPNLTIPE